MKVHIVEPTDDWCGIYIDGRLIFENHSISSRETLSIIETHQDGSHIDVIKWSYDDKDAVVEDRAENDGEVVYNGVPILTGWHCPESIII